MMFEKLRKRGAEMISVFDDTHGCPPEDEILGFLEKLTERERYIVLTLPVVVCDYEFDVPDDMIGMLVMPPALRGPDGQIRKDS